MNDVFMRGLMTYAGLTVAIWLISFSMISNGANYSSNFGWPFISFLRSFFTGFGAVGVVAWLLIAWFTHLGEVERKRQETEKSKRDEKLAEQNRIRLEKENIKYRNERRIQEKKEMAQTAKRELLRLKQKEDERKIEEDNRRVRSADDAVRRTFEDFI